ncbi:DUF4267 domain-containing protein [Nonomuraea gerenzanensis]|uniref:Putative small membrane hydrophobic protein n=1 Tax=Nonomuraea gerenzanensis TaxID=93944 RepID=A0A1M4ELP8_9ACTN|nr:DUF4267 domain-containing protein [Nonomuraea gerenzanensis]UBU11292.1 DUF4267 domain-containing protein [Nonomuraea gerenzanensis]SBO99767.1 putative small membrane hydrophobic protein [Nonomuraea gerenzanensis]
MLTYAAYGLAIALNLLVLFIGARFLLAPRPAAAGYGVPAKEDGDPAFLTIKGLRDGSFGLLGLALLAFVGPLAAAWFMVVVALVPLGDTVIVLRHGGTKAVAFGIHFATAVVVLLSAALLFAVS